MDKLYKYKFIIFKIINFSIFLFESDFDKYIFKKMNN